MFSLVRRSNTTQIQGAPNGVQWMVGGMSGAWEPLGCPRDGVYCSMCLSLCDCETVKLLSPPALWWSSSHFATKAVCFSKDEAGRG